MSRIALFLFLGAVSAFGPLSIDLYLPALPSIADDLNASPSLVALSLTACVLGLAGGQVVAGPLSDRYGRRPIMTLGLAGYFVSSVLCAVAPGAGSFVVLRLIQGICGAFGMVVGRAIVRDLHSGVAMSHYLSRLTVISGLAPILAPLAGGQILRVTSWRGSFVVLAVIGLLLLVVCVTMIPETHPPDRRSGGVKAATRAMLRVGADRSFLAFGLPSGFEAAAFFAYLAGSSFVIQDVYGASAQTFSLLFALNAVGVVAASQLNAVLVRRVRLERLMGTGLALATAGAALTLGVVLADLGLVALVPALLLFVSAGGIVGPNATALVLADHPAAAGAAAGLLGVTQFVIGAILSPIAGIGGKDTALPMALLMLSLNAVALTVFLRVRRTPVLASADMALISDTQGPWVDADAGDDQDSPRPMTTEGRP